MKKTAIFLSILAIAATAAFVATADDAVYSANTIGVIKYDIPAAGGLTCISLPLNPLDSAGWTWGETTLAEQLDVGSTVYFWNGTQWDPYVKGKLKGWNDEAKNKVIPGGMAFFVKSDVNSSSAKEITLVGELPVEDELKYIVGGHGALETRAVTMYPVSDTFGNSDLAQALPVGSTIYFWDGAQWNPYVKGSLKGWNDEAKATVNFVGEGAFIKSPANAENVEVTITRPFDWE